jgi:hypothetical protein
MGMGTGDNKMPLPQLQTYPGIETPRPADAMMKAQTMKNEMARVGIAQQQADTAQNYLGLAKKKFGQDKEILEFNKMQKNLEIGKQFIPSLTKEEYPKFREWAKSIGAPVDLLPEEAPEDFDAFKEQLYLGADNLTKTNLAQYKAIMDQIKSDKKAKDDLKLEAEKQKNRLQLAEKNAALKNTKSEKATAYTTPMNQILKEYGGGTGMKITTNPDGTMSFSQGGEKAYQDMVEKAKTDPKAKRDLATYEVLKEKLLATTGTDAVEASTQKRLIFQDGKFIEK